MKDYILEKLEEIQDITGYNALYLQNILFDTDWDNETLEEKLEEIKQISIERDWNLTPEESKKLEY